MKVVGVTSSPANLGRRKNPELGEKTVIEVVADRAN